MTETKKRYPKETSFPLGYDENILGNGVIVPLPTFTDRAKKDALLDENGQVKSVPHLHYTIGGMNKVRKLAIFTANSLDGRCGYDLERPKVIWRPDPEIPIEYQIPDSFYKWNNWDGGHFTRCKDVSYGRSPAEALQAMIETFFDSNRGPQHCNFNQDEWLAMENWYWLYANTRKIPVSVFTGPIFGDWDILRSNVKIPQVYWKVIALIHPERKSPVSTAFLMNQTEMWRDKNGDESMKLCLYQVRLERIEQLTGLEFGEPLVWDVLDKRVSPLTKIRAGLVQLATGIEAIRIDDINKIVI